MSCALAAGQRTWQVHTDLGIIPASRNRSSRRKGYRGQQVNPIGFPGVRPHEITRRPQHPPVPAERQGHQLENNAVAIRCFFMTPGHRLQEFELALPGVEFTVDRQCCHPTLLQVPHLVKHQTQGIRCARGQFGVSWMDFDAVPRRPTRAGRLGTNANLDAVRLQVAHRLMADGARSVQARQQLSHPVGVGVRGALGRGKSRVPRLDEIQYQGLGGRSRQGSIVQTDNSVSILRGNFQIIYKAIGAA